MDKNPPPPHVLWKNLFSLFMNFLGGKKKGKEGPRMFPEESVITKTNDTSLKRKKKHSL